MNARRSSTFGARAMRSDPRPNTDKAYMNQCIRFLIKFLSEHHYDHTISPKMLSRPMKKDFSTIVSFLFRLIDPNFRFSEKIEDDVTTMYRQLRYCKWSSIHSYHQTLRESLELLGIRFPSVKPPSLPLAARTHGRLCSPASHGW